MSSNITFQEFHITKQEHRKQLNQHSCIIWFTGLSGSGKSTLANALTHKLYEKNYKTYSLDGDNIRHGLNNDLTFTEQDRVENIRRIAHVAQLFVDAGLIVTSSFISPYEEEREYCKGLVEEDEFVEVFVKAPLEVCEQRDVKGLYQKARDGIITNFTGISAPYEEPKNPHITLDTQKHSIEECITQLITYLQQRGIIENE